MKSLAKTFITVLFSLLLIPNLIAQDERQIPGLRWHLDEDKSSYAGVFMVNQIWTRYIQNNPDKNRVEQYPDFDLGIRRSRLIFYTYLMDKVFIYTQVGTDGLTYRSTKNPAVKLFNAQTEYIFIKEKLHLGFGLNTWNGVSRYSNSNLSEFLVADHPGFAYPIENTFDLAGRQLGIYAKGALGKLHYRVSVAKPFEYGIDSISTPVTTERINENFALKGYFSWQFFEKENTLFPYMTMNNLGRQKLFNIGAGFYFHPEAMLVEAEKDLSTVDPMLAGMLILAGAEHLLPQFAGYFPSQMSDILVAAADVFLDLPLRNNGAITSYLSYTYNFFGPNYLRSMSKMNVSKMPARMALPQGAGNSEWEIGTGHIVRGEFGYLIPGTGWKNRFQPYAAFTWKNFEALDEASLQFDAGLNWFLNGHNMKWTLQYSSRPIYVELENRNIIDNYKGQIILQTQICF
jgi:hypothetical protein